MKSLFENQEYCTVSQLTAQIKTLLENGFSQVWVVGEISSLTRAGSGHVYLSLKDKDAVLRSVIWRSTALQMRFLVHEGMEVLARGRISVYPPRGDYQLTIEHIEPRGMGAAEQALKRLKIKLAGLGYFAAERKRPLARFPRRLALLTSSSGAALRDMLEILGRRWPAAEVLICAVRVQGQGAAQEIARRLSDLNAISGIDTVILGRGGGSSEDLAAFNEEIVARAIFHSRAPVVSAVGHEVDVTIADLVADKRALTPSEAAELATPDRVELWKTIQQRDARLRALMTTRHLAASERLGELAQRRVFRLPLERIRERERRLDDCLERLGRAVKKRLGHVKQALENRAAQLASLSPLNVLARGYSLTRTIPEKQLIHSAHQVHPRDRIEIRLHEGRLVATVEEIESPSEEHHA